MTKVTDGHQLEKLVAYVEQTLIPKGFRVELNRIQYDSAGTAMAEFDIEVRGKVGTGEIAWLIECRDRPSDGAAPGSWIEQLVGRRDRFQFNKVTAVSTTGFSPAARQYAAESGIDLREVKSIDPKEFSWLDMEYMTFRERVHNLKNATINIVGGQPGEAVAEFIRIVRSSNYDTPFLVNSTGATTTVMGVFFHTTQQIESLWDQMLPNGEPKPVDITAAFREEDHLSVITSHGNVAVGSIRLVGELFIREKLVAPETFKYQQAATGSTISEIVTFPTELNNKPVAIEIHKIAGEEYMNVLLRVKDE
ncbi:MAG TPA: restriction endonuclease [Rhizomicrobium sp.]|jgi:hypothetical protein|nr:restriction endonuclease [Rhizomicrobium sp.]